MSFGPGMIFAGSARLCRWPDPTIGAGVVRSHRQQRLPPSIVLRPHRRRRILLAVASGLVLALLAWERIARPDRQADDYARYHDQGFVVVNVVDGDTIVIDAPDHSDRVTRIRLWGVDTPEVARGDKAGMHFGAEATEYAKAVLLGRRVHVALSPDKSRDKYDRLLAYVLLERGGRMFNEMLLEEGYSYADPRFEHHYARQFQALEKRARKAGRGLWAGVTREQMPGWRQRFERSLDENR
jgi:micrococcal nuclease